MSFHGLGGHGIVNLLTIRSDVAEHFFNGMMAVVRRQGVKAGLAAMVFAFAAGSEAAEHVIHISVDGLRPDYLQTLIDDGQTPNFKRLQVEGAWTHNARTNYTHSITLPNHTSMVTGRPVTKPSGAADTLHHGWVTNVNPLPTATLHNSGNLNVPYKASTWDVAHDAGLRTAHYASKSKFVIYEQSYNATAGAEHPNGRDKIDAHFAQENASATMQPLLLAELAAQHTSYTFVHYADPDIAGHGSGWGGVNWQNAVKVVDGYLVRKCYWGLEHFSRFLAPVIGRQYAGDELTTTASIRASTKTCRLELGSSRVDKFPSGI